MEIAKRVQGNGMRAGARPRYVEIKEAIRKAIADGEYEVSEALPSERSLTEQFAASRVTIRHALSELQKERLIFSRRGKGHYVARPVVVQPLTRLLGLGEVAESSGLRIRSDVLSGMIVAAGPDVAAALRLSVGADVFELRRLRYLNDKPLSVDISYFPVELGVRLKECDLDNTDVFVLLENRLGVELGLADIKIRMVLADKHIATALQASEGEPVLHLTRLTSTTDGDPIDFEYIYGRGDAYQFRVTVARC